MAHLAAARGSDAQRADHRPSRDLLDKCVREVNPNPSRAEVARVQFCLCVGGGGETTPLVCCLLFAIFCGCCWCVSWVVCVHCFCLLLCSACCAQCVRARGGDLSSARACVRVWRFVHVHASVVDLASLSARGRPPDSGAGIDTDSAMRACAPLPPPARQRASARRDYVLFSRHHHHH